MVIKKLFVLGFLCYVQHLIRRELLQLFIPISFNKLIQDFVTENQAFDSPYNRSTSLPQKQFRDLLVSDSPPDISLENFNLRIYPFDNNLKDYLDQQNEDLVIESSLRSFGSDTKVRLLKLLKNHSKIGRFDGAIKNALL